MNCCNANGQCQRGHGCPAGDPEPHVPVDPAYRAQVWRRIITAVLLGVASMAAVIVYTLI